MNPVSNITNNENVDSTAQATTQSPLLPSTKIVIPSVPVNESDVQEVNDSGVVAMSDVAKVLAASNPNLIDSEQNKILLVEDEEDVRTIFTDILTGSGFEVSTAVDGEDAIAKAAADKFNLIFMDIVMPNLDGIEALRTIKSDPVKYSDCPIVMLTNIAGDVAVEKALQLGAAGYRLKVETSLDSLPKDAIDFINGKKQDLELEPVHKDYSGYG